MLMASFRSKLAIASFITTIFLTFTTHVQQQHLTPFLTPFDTPLSWSSSSSSLHLFDIPFDMASSSSSSILAIFHFPSPISIFTYLALPSLPAKLMAPT